MSVTSDQTDAQFYDQHLHHNIQVTEVNGGDTTNPMWTSEIDGPDFGAALKHSLASAGLLGEGPTAYSLRANLLRVEQPIFGVDFEVTCEAEYTLTESSSNTVIFREIIRTPYTAGMGDSLIGIKRLRLANEGSARSNIGALLKRLKALDLEAKQVSLQKHAL